MCSGSRVMVIRQRRSEEWTLRSTCLLPCNNDGEVVLRDEIIRNHVKKTQWIKKKVVRQPSAMWIPPRGVGVTLCVDLALTSVNSSTTT